MTPRYVMAMVVLTGCASMPANVIEVERTTTRTIAEPRPVEVEGQGDDEGQVPASTEPDGRDPESARLLALQLLAGTGWETGEEWSCLETLFELESGWRFDAEGSTQDHGIPQAHGPSHPETDDDLWRNDPRAQLEWGIAYIAGRYGTPCAALDAWMSRADERGRGGWY
jgi:resuscitation-promoting factor RpfB